MISDVLLITAAVVTTTVAFVFAVWSFRVYVDFKRSQQTNRRMIQRFADIRAAAVDSSGRSLPAEDLDVEGLVKLLFEIEFVNLADVPRDWIARARKLGSRK
jgi:hypothetical protein